MKRTYAILVFLLLTFNLQSLFAMKFYFKEFGMRYKFEYELYSTTPSITLPNSCGTLYYLRYTLNGNAETVQISEKEWQSIQKKIRRYRMFDYDSSYHPAPRNGNGVMPRDMEQWYLHIVSDDKEVTSSGYGVFPKGVREMCEYLKDIFELNNHTAEH